MPDLLVRGVREDVKAELANRAAREGRSLQAEARRILEEAVGQQAAKAIKNEEAAPDYLDLPSSVLSRIEKRKQLFASLDSVNAQIDAAGLPDAVQMVRSMREEKDQSDQRWFVGLFSEGGLA